MQLYTDPKTNLIFIEKKTKEILALALDNPDFNNLEYLKSNNVNAILYLNKDNLDELTTNKWYENNMPIFSYTGEYEVCDFIIKISNNSKVSYSSINLDNLEILFLNNVVNATDLNLQDTNIIIGKPAMVSIVQFSLNPQQVILIDQQDLENYKKETGISDIVNSKKIVLKQNSEDELSQTTVYLLTK